MHTWGAVQVCRDKQEGAGGLAMPASNASIEPSGPGNVAMVPAASSIEPAPEPIPLDTPLEPEDPVAPRDASPAVSVAPDWPPQAKRVNPRQRPTTAQAHRRLVENVTCMGTPGA